VHAKGGSVARNEGVVTFNSSVVASIIGNGVVTDTMRQESDGSYSSSYGDSSIPFNDGVIHIDDGGMFVEEGSTAEFNNSSFAFGNNISQVSSYEIPRNDTNSKYVFNSTVNVNNNNASSSFTAKKKEEVKKINVPPSEKEEIVEDGNVCVMCYEREIKTAILPCGHSVLCISCSRKIAFDKDEYTASCPVCRTPIGQIIKIFNK
jgi:hypothetical protein